MEKKIVYFFISRRNAILGCFAISVLIGIIAYEIIPFFIARGKASLAIEVAYKKWRKDPQNIKTFDEIKASFKKYPQLASKYEGVIVQDMLRKNDISRGICFAYDAIRRTEKESKKHFLFSRISLFIAQQEYKKALEQSYLLKNRLEKNSTLFAFNLIRIAFLERIAGNREYEALEEIERYFKENRDKTSKKILRLFNKDERITLQDYIEHRKNLIS